MGPRDGTADRASGKRKGGKATRWSAAGGKRGTGSGKATRRSVAGGNAGRKAEGRPVRTGRGTEKVKTDHGGRGREAESDAAPEGAGLFSRRVLRMAMRRGRREFSGGLRAAASRRHDRRRRCQSPAADRSGVRPRSAGEAALRRNGIFNDWRGYLFLDQNAGTPRTLIGSWPGSRPMILISSGLMTFHFSRASSRPSLVLASSYSLLNT